MSAKQKRERMNRLKTGISYIWEAKDWTDGVKGAASIAELQAHIKRWQPFVQDALIASQSMNWDEWLAGREGAFQYPDGQVTPEWMDKFGAIVLPVNLIIAGQVAERFHAPLGTALLRLYEEHPDLLRDCP